MKILSWFLVIFGIFGLVGVRFVEDDVFYDPFLDFFQGTKKNFPDVDFGKLIASHLFRFALNLLFSLIVVHFLFRNKEWTVQALVLMVLVFVITFPIYLYCVYTKFEIGNLFTFYVRRFVIQPLVLL
ncbi:MAG: exosortase F system-associated protein, partial [Cruoricaptor ignavus]|nr:exosortase F system-associated protein [Cruoricaptor ignavus]